MYLWISHSIHFCKLVRKLDNTISNKVRAHKAEMVCVTLLLYSEGRSDLNLKVHRCRMQIRKFYCEV